MSRRGATLVELMIAVFVMGIVGAGLARLLSSQSRFFNDQEGQANARRAARIGLNLLLSDLRMAESDSGIVAASPASLTLNLPYRMGISCGPDMGNSRTYVAQQPIDSILRADAGFTGYAWVDSTGEPHYVPGGNRTIIAGSVCTAVGVDTIPGGRVVSITPELIGANVGVPVYSYEQVTYYFAASSAFPGSQGLYRTVTNGVGTEEIAAPLDTLAKFQYWVAGNGTPVANPGGGVEIIGVDLSLTGLNDRLGITSGKTQSAPYLTTIFFRNR